MNGHRANFVMLQDDPAADIVWEGPGWYAPRQHADSDRQEFTRFYPVGNDRQNEPDTYSQGLGTPEWFDEPA